MEALDKIRNIKIYDSTKYHTDECIQAYMDYIEKLKVLDLKQLSAFLLALKRKEIVNSQKAEMVPSLLSEFLEEFNGKDPIETYTDLINEGSPLTQDNFKELHKKVIVGTEDDIPRNYSFRDYPVRVSEFNNNVENVMYVPPEKEEEIISYVDFIIDYLNDNSGLQIETIFLKPIICHAFISILQPFGNGNTRFARLVQHGKIYEYTNKILNQNFELPVIYLSKSYLLSRGDYRKRIAMIASSKESTEVEFSMNDSWNRWFNYNLNCIDEQLFYANNTLEAIIRRHM